VAFCLSFGGEERVSGVSPMYLGGNNGISLSINVSHNFANSSHYDSLDFGPSIVIWIMDDEANKFCDQYLVFNNVVETINNEEGKSGLLIKISDGMIMSFQGDTLQHGTTIRQDSITGKVCPPGNISDYPCQLLLLFNVLELTNT